MSYINKQNTALVKVKLTDIGRQKMAQGALTFAKYGIGDSEVDYNYVRGWAEFEPNFPSTTLGAANGEFLFPLADGDIDRNIFSKVLRPKDDQPFFSSFLLDQNGQETFPINTFSNLQLITGLVTNEAADRGFFSGSTVDEGLTAVTTTQFIKESGTIDLSAFTGGTDLTTSFLQGTLTLDTPLTATTANDYIMFRFSNCTLGSVTGDTMTAATINTFYNIVSISGNAIHVDRALPTLSACGGTIITYYTFPGGDDPIDNYYGLPSQTAYWNTGTLSFDSSCDICVENIPVWNMNNVWSEELAGLFNDPLGDDYHTHTTFGSEQYAGTKQFLEYNSIVTNPNRSYMDTVRKGISIIHYTNNTISNFYGEQFYINEPNGKLVNLDIPVMWHRRNEGTGSGTTLGMRFVSAGDGNYLSDNNSIVYHDLIEFSGMCITPEDVIPVGKVFPQLKMVVIDNEELVAAMSYKSNRNYTLPDLSAFLSTPEGGNCTGCLGGGEKMFLTYVLENTGTTTTSTLPCQRYTVINNNTTPGMGQDVSFTINDIEQLPYMRKTELGGYDGFGFFADEFKILCQVTNVPGNLFHAQGRPDPSLWRVIDFTSPLITGVSGETINPLLLQTQTPTSAGFLITGDLYGAASATTFDLGTELDMSSGEAFGKMTFGDERLFYGNLRTFISATIYKSLFTINVDGNTISDSENSTYTSGPRYITEVGVMDADGALVLVGKLSRPIKLGDQSTASIELTIDF